MFKKCGVADEYNFVHVILTDGEDNGSKTDFEELAGAFLGIGLMIKKEQLKNIFIGVGLDAKAEKELKILTKIG
jgi:hypothetical protein